MNGTSKEKERKGNVCESGRNIFKLLHAYFSRGVNTQRNGVQ